MSKEEESTLNHFSFLVNRKTSFTILENYPTKPTAWSFPGGFGYFQGFYKGVAVVGGHLGGEDNLRYSQRVVQVKRPSPM